MEKEILIDDNLGITVRDKAIILTQGRTYISLSMGIISLILSIIVLYLAISNANYPILYCILPFLLIALYTLGFYQKIEINGQDRILEKSYALFNKVSVTYARQPFYKTTFVIEQIEQSEGEPKVKLFLIGELYPIFLFNLNSMKTADNFKRIVEERVKEYKLEMI